MLEYLFGLALFLQLEPNCFSKPREPKIFGGQTKDVENFSFLVNLRRGGDFRCGGALISPSCVLTAAHCLEWRHHEVRDLTVHAQQQCLGEESSPEHERRAWYTGVSPYYSPHSGLDSDVAVIRLTRPFDISGNASLIRIDFNDLPRRVNFTVLGWGMTREHGHDRNQCLQVAEVHKIPQKQCVLKMDTEKQRVTRNMFCALGEIDTDACQGDSGGPVIHNDRTVGIVSWGYGCGSGYPGVYTRLSSPTITYWLKTFVERHCWW